MSLRARWQAVRNKFATRLLAGLLIVTLSISVGLAMVLTRTMSNGLTASIRHDLQGTAQSAARAIDNWLDERRGDFEVTASLLSGRLADPLVPEVLRRIASYYKAYDVIEVADLNGVVLHATSQEERVDPAGQDWFRAAAAGDWVLSEPRTVDGRAIWPIAKAIVGPDGRPEGVLVGDLRESRFTELLARAVGPADVVIDVIDADKRLVYGSDMGEIDEHGDAPVGREREDNIAVRRALVGETSAARFRDPEGKSVYGGFTMTSQMHWAVLAEADAATVLAPVHQAHRNAALLTLLAALSAIVFSLLFARRATTPLLHLAAAADAVSGGDLSHQVEPTGASELRRVGESFNTMVEGLRKLIAQVRGASVKVSDAASGLAIVSEQLATTTTEQSAAITETSASTEELGRTSVAIAETVDAVALQAHETRENLEQAEADIQASADRTTALAERVREIGGILVLIDDLADQTNLLALNAAIEAARAGENGRGFSVVAEEVRRLAERSKVSASDINKIIEGIRTETDATVMAMEQGSKQLQQGIGLLHDVADATAKTSFTTQDQRNATGQVVEAMEQLSDSSRQVSGTAQEIATAVADLATLASQLEHTAAQAMATA